MFSMQQQTGLNSMLFQEFKDLTWQNIVAKVVEYKRGG